MVAAEAAWLNERSQASLSAARERHMRHSYPSQQVSEPRVGADVVERWSNAEASLLCGGRIS